MDDIDRFQNCKELYLYYIKLKKELFRIKKSNIIDDIANKKIDREIRTIENIIINLNNYSIKTRKEWISILLNIFNKKNDNNYYFQLNKYEECFSTINIDKDNNIINNDKDKILKRVDAYILSNKEYNLYSLDFLTGDLADIVDENWTFDLNSYLNGKVKLELFKIPENNTYLLNAKDDIIKLPPDILNKLKEYLFYEYKNEKYTNKKELILKKC